MAIQYPQFSIRRGPLGTWWDGWLAPFRSRPFLRYRLFLLYSLGHDPIAWIVQPEISKRTWPCHRHLYGHGNLCPQDPDAPNWEFGQDDLTYYIDLVVLWLGCHIHLEEYGRWPGPEAPRSHLHGTPTFRSPAGVAERLISDFIAKYGLRALRLIRPDHGVPLGLVERIDLVGMLDYSPTPTSHLKPPSTRANVRAGPPTTVSITSGLPR